MNRHCLGHLIVSLCLWLAGQGQSLAADLQQEQVTTTPVYAAGVLYTASTETVSRRGHLRAIDILDTFPKVLWDAAEQVPPAGTSRTQPESVQPDNLYRTVFTNLNDVLLPLEAGQAERLQLILGSASVAEAELLLHAVRGRRSADIAHAYKKYCHTWIFWHNYLFSFICTIRLCPLHKVRRAKLTNKDQWLNDGDGLYLRIRKGGSRNWIIRRKRLGKTGIITLGDTLSLKEVAEYDGVIE